MKCSIYVSSYRIKDQKLIDGFTSEKSNTFLVSFPRTGSHWLRMIIELYFQRPTLVRTFYYPEKKDYILLHTHDLDLDIQRDNVIYLYRNPVDTMFSQLKYHKEDIENKERIIYWTSLYGKHLEKWLIEEEFTKKKTVIRYEQMKTNLHIAFQKVCQHFEKEFDVDLLDEVSSKVTKNEVKKKTLHDQQVIKLTKLYSDERKYFKSEYSNLVLENLFDGREQLRNII
ncbi:MAG: hypothetical protein GQ565_07160 [Candidatus Aegiribacteria sp.]|nr:hypothetical protein [Candidatus Aegiribacteria sp.]